MGRVPPVVLVILEGGGAENPKKVLQRSWKGNLLRYHARAPKGEASACAERENLSDPRRRAERRFPADRVPRIPPFDTSPKMGGVRPGELGRPPLECPPPAGEPRGELQGHEDRWESPGGKGVGGGSPPNRTIRHWGATLGLTGRWPRVTNLQGRMRAGLRGRRSLPPFLGFLNLNLTLSLGNSQRGPPLRHSSSKPGRESRLS